MPTSEEVEEAVRKGSESFRYDFLTILPTERCSQFLYKCVCYKLPNGEDVHRDWLAWSNSKGAVFCFLVGSSLAQSSIVKRSLAASSTAGLFQG